MIYVSDNKVSDEGCYSLPKYLFDPQSQFYDLNLKAKLLYSVLLEEAKKCSKDFNSYFEIKRSDMCEILNVGYSALKSAIDELKKYNLLEEEKNGVGNNIRMRLILPKEILNDLSWQRKQEKEQEIYEEIKDQIKYNFIVNKFNKKSLDDIVMVIFDLYMNDSLSYVKINGEEKPLEVVKNVIKKVDCTNIEFVLERFKRLTKEIIKPQRYILTMLYNSVLEMDLKLTNEVQSDKWSF